MTTLEILEMLRIISNDPQILTTARLRANSFTRIRGMPFSDALSFMLDMRTTTLQTRLNLYFGPMMKGGDPMRHRDDAGTDGLPCYLAFTE